jgi:sigma-B regulation protein RsbU (phosphoserine phosphatase)
MPTVVPAIQWATGEPARRPLFRIWPDTGAVWRQLSRYGQQQQRWVWALGMIALAFLLVQMLAVWLSVRLARRLVRAVNLLTHAAGEIGSGNLAYRIPVKRHDQLGRLGQALNQMAESLGRLNQETRERQRMEDELRVARQVQESLLPDRLPQLEHTDLAAACLPARNVSGDVYDVIALGGKRVGLLCADVSGKGVPAALLMSNVQAMIRFFVGSSNGNAPAPAALVQRLNQEVCRHSPANTFVTLFWAEYDAGRRLLRWANAGHCPALLLCGSEEAWLAEGGIPVGILPTAEYTDQERILPAGATLVAYSDGVTEAERPDGEAFGEAGLVRACLEHSGTPAEEMVREIVQSVRSWTGGADPSDDLTLVVMRT